MTQIKQLLVETHTLLNKLLKQAELLTQSKAKRFQHIQEATSVFIKIKQGLVAKHHGVSLQQQQLFGKFNRFLSDISAEAQLYTRTQIRDYERQNYAEYFRLINLIQSNFDRIQEIKLQNQLPFAIFSNISVQNAVGFAQPGDFVRPNAKQSHKIIQNSETKLSKDVKAALFDAISNRCEVAVNPNFSAAQDLELNSSDAQVLKSLLPFFKGSGAELAQLVQSALTPEQLQLILADKSHSLNDTEVLQVENRHLQTSQLMVSNGSENAEK